MNVACHGPVLKTYLFLISILIINVIHYILVDDCHKLPSSAPSLSSRGSKAPDSCHSGELDSVWPETLTHMGKTCLFLFLSSPFCTVGQAAMLPIICSVFLWHSFGWLTLRIKKKKCLLHFFGFILFRCYMLDDFAWDICSSRFVPFSFFPSFSFGFECAPPLLCQGYVCPFLWLLCFDLPFDFIELTLFVSPPPSCVQPVFLQCCSL